MPHPTQGATNQQPTCKPFYVLTPDKPIQDGDYSSDGSGQDQKAETPGSSELGHPRKPIEAFNAGDMVEVRPKLWMGNKPDGTAIDKLNGTVTECHHCEGNPCYEVQYPHSFYENHVKPEDMLIIYI